MKLKKIVFVTAIIAAKALQLAQADYIVGGSDVKPGDAIAKTTVALVIGPALCTGSIIDTDLIVTAAHCLEGNPSSIAIVFSTQLNAEISKKVIPAAGYVIHPDYKLGLASADQHDIALISFRGGLPSGYTPNHMLGDERLLKKGESVILAGYGITDADSRAGAGTLRETSVAIEDENFGKTEVLLAQNGGHGACHGDSGGPAFLPVGGTLLLWGVTSRGYPNRAPDDCAHDSVYTKIMDHVDFIHEAILKLRH